jgi:hypothetical protein
MTNLYEFLKMILDDARRSAYNTVNISTADQDWLEQFLTAPDAELHFKAKRVGGTDDNPEMAQDYAIAGAEVDIFSLITEAMLQNSTFALTIQRAAYFFQEHVPTCPDCQATILRDATKPPSWEFLPHKLTEK